MRKALAIARVVFLELVTDKVLYNTLFIGAGLLGLAWVGATLAVLGEGRVLQDFGLAAIDLSCGAIGLLGGATALPRAYERRTAVLVLTRPVSRAQHVAGTYLGCATLVTLNWLLLSSVFLATLAGFSGTPPSAAVLLAPLALGLAQALVVAALAVAASSFLTSSLSVVVTLILFLAGTNVSQLQAAALRTDSELVRLILRGLATVLPNFEIYSMSFLTSYRLPLGVGHAPAALLYGCVVVAASLALGSFLVRFRSI